MNSNPRPYRGPVHLPGTQEPTTGIKWREQRKAHHYDIRKLWLAVAELQLRRELNK